ncbi:uncharacterized protein L969DRAFT_18957 [Mixia osmundae IAM 14324]|uniref:Uncharacterized protein n=1 Tax=Mixia osmundae (strain CBS 9802 / IAM 14324 / JCM 22182 / KY 12970) TaxID=764103 RepID=G7DWR6_MIXOS|nr:uncharacterized protein L969DRAFT_283545 [Mixia osmundae IAM 14324]XP_014566413.1 uncharacterized protein L969DRAFT_18957 [Mixia osmundae IAM 14324]KEI36209.1 hypothetical protein L969DRAFT_283545 [Mixia osmundae IAM 14324]KEI38177.1 hypothetical protein L969DRAFT_18957 [Mixia osmundae IAM 14324]GAA95013.1 hypothetical protein E5Q_01668 [Mixia osmundae IAM 14324]
MSTQPGEDVALDKSSSINSVIASENANAVIDRNTTHYFAFSAATFLILISIPMIFFPRLLSIALGDDLASVEGEGGVLRPLSQLECFFALIAGIAHVALSLMLIIQTGAIPLVTTLSADEGEAMASPFRSPAIAIASGYLGGLAAVCWSHSLRFIAINAAGLTVFGLWSLVFGANLSLNSKGKDKHQSSFPFKNDSAEDRKKA